MRKQQWTELSNTVQIISCKRKSIISWGFHCRTWIRAILPPVGMLFKATTYKGYIKVGRSTEIPPYSWFCFPQFQLSVVNCGLKIKMETSRNKQFINFKLCVFLSSMMKFLAVPLHPTWDVNHPSVQHIHSLYIHHPLVT